MSERRAADELLDALSRLELDAPPPLPEEQSRRICERAARQIFQEQNGCQDTERGSKMENGTKKGRRTLGRAVRIGLIAAALCCGGTLTVCAVGPQIVSMLNGSIGFFSEAPSQSAVSDPVEAPRTDFDENREKLEAYNAPIGQTVTSGGVSVTLDNISMDVSSMDIFLTITGKEAIDAILSENDYRPLWDRFWGRGPNFSFPLINGEMTAQPDAEDWYLSNDGSLKLWRHYILTETPEGEEITVELKDDTALGRSGAWDFTVTLDGESVRAGAKAAGPADYPMQPVTYEIGGESYTVGRGIYLKYLAFGPVGGVLQLDTREREVTGPDGSEMVFSDGFGPGELYITDNTGKELYMSRSRASGAVNLTAPDADATSITLTPVVPANPDGSGTEERTISLDELKAGVTIATSPLGGYTVENFTIQEGVICYDLVPYGWAPNSASGVAPEILRPQDGGKITEVKEEVTGLQDGETATFLKSGLLSYVVDPQTGVVSVRHDYYAATDDELGTITEWKYDYREVNLDTEHAVTVQLNPLES